MTAWIYITVQLLLLVVLTLDVCESFNHLDKANIYKSKYLEQRLTDISSNLQTLTEEITSLKKVSKKLVKHVTKDWTGPQKEAVVKQTKLLAYLRPKPQGTTSCPEGYEFSIRHKCYHIEAERVKWAEAGATCQNMGGTLVMIDSSSEQNYIIEQLEKSRVHRYCDMWTSGSDAAQEGTWQWMTSPINKPVTFTNWQKDEPNNGGGGQEHCMWLDWYFGWKWNDAKCDTDKACFICQTDKI